MESTRLESSFQAEDHCGLLRLFGWGGMDHCPSQQKQNPGKAGLRRSPGQELKGNVQELRCEPFGINMHKIESLHTTQRNSTSDKTRFPGGRKIS